MSPRLEPADNKNTIMKFEEPTFKPSAKSSGYFRVGSVTPKKSRTLCKPAVEKRKHNYKRGINSAENRQRRSQLSRDLGRTKKNAALRKLRSARSANRKAFNAQDVKSSAREKLLAFYNVYNPSKLGEVDKTLERYTGKEEELFTKLAKRYSVSPSVFGVNAAAILAEKVYTGSAREKLVAFYNDYNPAKLSEVGTVDKTLAKYTGQESKLFTSLAKRYNVNPSSFGIHEEDMDTPVKSNSGAFMAYASTTNNTFGSLATPRANGFGSFATQASSSDNGRRRSTINSLNTFAEDGSNNGSFVIGKLRYSGVPIISS